MLKNQLLNVILYLHYVNFIGHQKDIPSECLKVFGYFYWLFLWIKSNVFHGKLTIDRMEISNNN